MVNPLVWVGGGAAVLWLMNKKSDPVDALVSQAMPIAQQHIDNGVPAQQAIQLAANQVTKALPPPPPVTYSSTPVATTPTGPILSLSDPRIAAAIANKNAMFGAEISAVGMPLDVRNALVAQGWTWTGSYFNPGGLYPPGTDPAKIIVAG